MLITTLPGEVIYSKSEKNT